MARLFLFTTQPALEQVVLGHPGRGPDRPAQRPRVLWSSVWAHPSCFLIRQNFPTPEISLTMMTKLNNDHMRCYWYESQWAGTEIVCYCLCKVFPVLAPHPPGPGRQQPAGTASIQPQPPALTHRRVFTVLFINTHWHNILYWTGHYLPSRDLFVTIVYQHGQHYNQLDQQLLLLSVIL